MNSVDVGAQPTYADYASDAEAKIAERKIVAGLAQGAAWTDLSFPASGASLYLNEFQPPKYALPASTIDWNRISQREVRDCVAPVTFRTASPLALAQGALRDRWFLSALGAMTAKPELLRAVVVSSQQAARGVYTCKFYKQGKWRYVHVDDLVPCDRSGRTHFARAPDPNVVWPIVVEKAYAKLHGCYEAIVTGCVADAIRDLSARPADQFRLSEPAVARKVADGRFWAELETLQADGNLVAFLDLTPPVQPLDRLAAAGPNTGLLKQHSYSLLEMRTVAADATAAVDALDARMLKLGNPWLIGGWRGSWCRGDALWRRYPTVATECGVKEAEAGDSSSFWIEWTDFVEHFDTVLVAHQFAASGARETYRGKWVPGDARSGAGGAPACASWASNPQYCFDVTETSRVNATLSQLDPRWNDVGAEGLPAIGFVVQAVGGGKRAGKYAAAKAVGGTPAFVQHRNVAATMILQPGAYALVPSTLAPGKCAAQFVLEVRADLPLNFAQGGDTMADLEADDEEPGDLPADAELAQKVSTLHPPAQPLHEPAGKELESLWGQLSNLQRLLADLDASNNAIDAKLALLEDATPPVEDAAQC